VKIALMGDIHGNDLALQAVLDAAVSAHVEKLLLTGDLIGYYFAPLRVLELLNSWSYEVVRGNHEEMLGRARADFLYLSTINARYGSGVEIALNQLNKKQLDELCALPHPLELEIDGVRVLLCHGSPWDLDQYLYPDAFQGMFADLSLLNYDLIVMGHTHYPMQRQIMNTLVVNPGSVGQPRNHQPGAHWALFDTDNRCLEFRHEQYDSSRLEYDCRQRHPELPYLAEVLTRK